jgi:hypothetical protein
VLGTCPLCHYVLIPPPAWKFLRCSVNKFSVLPHLVYDKEFAWSSLHQCIPQDSFSHTGRNTTDVQVWIMGWESEQKLIWIDKSLAKLQSANCVVVVVVGIIVAMDGITTIPSPWKGTENRSWQGTGKLQKTPKWYRCEVRCRVRTRCSNWKSFH